MADRPKYRGGGGDSCAIVGCSNNRKKLYQWRFNVCDIHDLIHDECPCLLPFSLHKLPVDECQRLCWVKAINRKDLPKRVFICSCHFHDGRPTVENPIPSLGMGYENPGNKSRRILKRKIQADENKERDSFMTKRTDDRKYYADENSSMESQSQVTEDQDLTKDKGVQTSLETVCSSTQWSDESLQDHAYHQVPDSSISHCDASTQTPSKLHASKGVNCTTTHINMSQEKLNSDSESQLYTGLSLQAFVTLVNIFQNIELPFKFTMNVGDQLLLFLMRLRLNLLFADLGHRFGISQSQASKIFNCWLPVLSSKLKQLIVWLPRETIRAAMPSAFKVKYPKTTVIIDCAETFMQRPKNLKTRGETYSHYKSHNTVKYLIGIAPHGQIMFISKGFGGRASDRFIVEKSGFLQYLLPGDEVMADRGFTINDLLFPLRVKLNMPAFTKGKPQLSETEVTETRRIAHVRIHVERAIRRLKVYKILSNIVPVTSVKKLDDILIVCSALANLGPELIRDVQDEVEDSTDE